jgi:MoaA/NifB/PqqE/SkfB family radical SAM enzyme
MATTTASEVVGQSGPTEHGPTNLTVNQMRHWVRIADTCNQRCLFCLDSDAHIGRLRSVEEVEREFELGLQRGAERVIISGGEASVHPKFVYFVKRAREMGYQKVQTVTNGRIWSYKDFVVRAVRAGLSEVTFSMHGHTAKLHDKLVGVPGAFNQAIQGLRYCLEVPGLIVSVDVVMCRPNVFFLDEIVRFYSDMGVGEFDLLAMIPFGRGAPNPIEETTGQTRPQDAKLARRLLLEGGEIASIMPRVVRLAEERGLTIWTNRARPQELEGCEWLLQRPKKLFDEVYGAKEDFQEALAAPEGTWMRCADRCDYCFLQQLCDGFRAHKAERLAGSIAHGWWRSEWGPLPTELPVGRLSLEAPSLDDALEHLAAATSPVGECDARVESAGPDALATLGRTARGDSSPGAGAAVRVVSKVPAVLEAALEAPGVEVAALLVDETLAWFTASPRPGLTFVPYEKNTTVRYDEALPALVAAGARLEGFPFCLASAGGAQAETSAPATPGPGGAWALAANDHFDALHDVRGWNLDRLVESHLRGHYMVHSLRCASCARRSECPGLHVNYVRDGFGLQALDPTRYPVEAGDEVG